MFTKIGYLLNMCFNVFIKMRNFRIPADVISVNSGNPANASLVLPSGVLKHGVLQTKVDHYLQYEHNFQWSVANPPAKKIRPFGADVCFLVDFKFKWHQCLYAFARIGLLNFLQQFIIFFAYLFLDQCGFCFRKRKA